MCNWLVSTPLPPCLFPIVLFAVRELTRPSISLLNHSIPLAGCIFCAVDEIHSHLTNQGDLVSSAICIGGCLLELVPPAAVGKAAANAYAASACLYTVAGPNAACAGGGRQRREIAGMPGSFNSPAYTRAALDEIDDFLKTSAPTDGTPITRASARVYRESLVIIQQQQFRSFLFTDVPAFDVDGNPSPESMDWFNLNDPVGFFLTFTRPSVLDSLRGTDATDQLFLCLHSSCSPGGMVSYRRL